MRRWPLMIASTLLMFSCVEQKTTPLLNTTVINSIVFSLSAASPSDGQNAVLFDDSIVLSFSHPVDASTVTVNSTSNQCSGAIQLSKDSFASCLPLYPASELSTDLQLAFRPVSGFSAGSYKLKITDAIRSKDGIRLSNPLVYLDGFNATGVDGKRPVVISQIPAAGASEVDKETSISVLFSEPMDVTTFSATGTSTCSGTIQLSKDNFTSCLPLQTPVQLTYSGVGFSIAPITALSANTTYRLKLTTGLKDRANRTLVSTITSSFTVAKERIVSVSWAKNPAVKVHQLGGGYRVYYSTQKNFSLDHYATLSTTVPYVSGDSAPNSLAITFPKAGTWYFKVTAFSIDNPLGSLPSSEVELEVR